MARNGKKSHPAIRKRLRSAITTIKNASTKAVASSIENAVVAIITVVIPAVFFYAFWTPLSDWWQEWLIPTTPNTHLSILVARLSGDEDGSQTRHVVHSLEDQFSHAAPGALLHIQSYPATLQLGTGELSSEVSAAEQRGKQWLKRKNATLLIWGNVTAKDQVLRLRFVGRDEHDGVADNAPVDNTINKKAILSAKNYRLGEVLELPHHFDVDLGSALATVVASSIRPSYSVQRRLLA